MKRCRFEDLCNRFSCTQLMLTTFARSSGHFLKSKRLEGFLPSTNTSELPKSPRSLQRLICFPLFHNCKNCKCFSLSKFHMLIIIFVEILYFFFIFVATPGGCKGMSLLDCKAINQSIGVSNHHKEIGAPPPHRPEP